MTTDMNLVSITGFVTKDLLSTIKFLYYTEPDPKYGDEIVSDEDVSTE